MGKYGAFPGGGMNIQNLMKQAQKMQADVTKKQEEVAKQEIETSAGGGAVVVRATGDKVIKEIKIDPEVVNKEDVEMLQDLICVAVNEAMSKADSLMQDGLGSFNIPGIM